MKNLYFLLALTLASSPAFASDRMASRVINHKLIKELHRATSNYHKGCDKLKKKNVSFFVREGGNTEFYLDYYCNSPEPDCSPLISVSGWIDDRSIEIEETTYGEECGCEGK